GCPPPCRRDNLFTGFDIDDDLALSDLRVRDGGAGKRYDGPVVLVNTALNLVAGEELALQDRKAEAFVLTPYHCGSYSTGYRETPHGRRADGGPDPRYNMTLGGAVAISGAAAAPNMSFHQSRAQTALMTVLNVRLGWWLQTPRRFQDWTAGGPSFLW